MNIGTYQGASALAAFEKWQQVISENIAYGSAPGFKKTDVTFDGIKGDSTKLSRMGVSDDVPGTMPKVTSRINFTPGSLQHSDNNLDFAIQGSGFFQIQRSNGQLAYTRNGQFHPSPERTLVTSQGATVMGDGGPITLKEGGGPVAISSNGAISQDGEEIGKLAVYDFKDTSKLQRTGDGAFASSDAKVQPERMENPQVLSGFIENSNVSPLSEMVNLITVSRAYEASQKIISSSDDIGGKAIETLGNPPA